jgi:NADP-dependent aldehyde dehydrogenase
VILPAALDERFDAIVDDFCGSCLMGTGQFCTNPGFVLLIAGDKTDTFVETVKSKFAEAPVGTLLSKSGVSGLSQAIQTLRQAGAEVLVGGTEGGGQGASFANTLMRVSGQDFLANPEALQTEAFGNASLMVVAADVAEARDVLRHLEGNLTGCIYSHTADADDEAYNQLVGPLRQRVGRLINDKMPTGVAVSPAMNHGGPYPATGHPGFTAVGIPASLIRFAMLQSFDQVRPHRLPPLLQDKNPCGAWRLIDGNWTQDDVA